MILAPVSAFLAAPTLGLAALFGVLFFKTRNNAYGGLNDLFSALVLLLLVLPASSLAEPDIIWFNLISWAAVAGMLLGALGQLLLVFGMIHLQTSFVTGGIGITPVVAWFLALTFLSLNNTMLSQNTGWLSLAAVILGLMAAVLWSLRPKIARLFLGLMIAALAAWMLAVGMLLLGN